MAIASFIVVFKSLCLKLYDPDLWWHLASGRYMVQHGQVLRTDVFSFTLAGTPWINFEWLSQIALYGIFLAGGVRAVFGLKIILSLSALAWLALSLRSAGARGIWQGILLGIGFLVLRPRLLERTELVTLNLLPITIWLFLEMRGGRGRKIFPWILGGLMVLWCNLHGGFVYGLGIAVLFAIGGRWAKEPGPVCQAFERTLTIMLAAALINPYGPRLSGVIFDHLEQLGQGPSLIQEWSAPSFQGLPFFWALLAGAAVALFLAVLRREPLARFWGPSMVCFGMWGAFFYRNSALFVFVAAPFIAEAAPRLWPRQLETKRAAVWAWVAAVALLFGQAHSLSRPVPRDPVFWNHFPRGASQFIRDQNLSGRVFNSYEFGGYLEWALPDRLVFADGRYLFYPLLREQSQLNEALERSATADVWPRYFDRHGITYAVVKYPDLFFRYSGYPFHFSSLNRMFPRSGWALVFWDDASLVFVRRSAEFSPLIEREEYKSLWPYNLEQMEFLLKAKQVSPAAAEAELERNHRRTGPTARGAELHDLIVGLSNGEKSIAH